MAEIFRKIRSKRKTSSELDSRWGDVSISSPNQGSWSQGDQTSPGFMTSPRLRSPSDQGQQQRHGSLDSQRERRSPSFRGTSRPSPSSPDDRATSTDSASTIPKGHYDASVRSRRQSTRRAQGLPKQPPGPGLGIGILRNSHSVWEDASSSDDAFSDDDNERGTGARRRSNTTNSNNGRYLTVNADKNDYSRVPKSPPLSVTSRMRPYSYEPTASSMLPRTERSKYTSFTTPCTPAMPSEDPSHGHQEKNYMRRPNPLEPTKRQELVPSYEDLYG